MKAAEFAKLIKEAVRSAVREELAELLQEAVTVASTPQVAQTTEVRTRTLGKSGTTPHVQSSTAHTSEPTVLKPIDQLLEETRLNFTSADAKVFVNSAQRDFLNLEGRPAAAVATQLGMGAGVDISQLPFVKKAKEVLDLSYQKDKSRGI
jgi:hypothetical protein